MKGVLSRRGLLAALGAVGSGSLASCAGLPQDGPVRTSDAVVVVDSPLVQSAAGPVEGAEPEQIVSGFLRACAAGFSDGFTTARSFLLSTAAASWNPWGTVRVYSAEVSPVISRGDDGSVGVETKLVGTLDMTGVLTATAVKPFTCAYSLVTDARGQWRIASLPHGVLVSSSGLETHFAARSLYFLTADRSRLVPELRWVPRLTQLRSLVEAFANGPSSWLAAGVTTALPAGTKPGPQPVEVDGATCRIRLTTDSADSSLAAADRSLLAAQLWQTLRGVDGVTSMEVTVDGTSLGRAADLSVAGAPPAAAVAMSAGNVVEGLGPTRTTLVSTEALGTADARYPVTGADGAVYVVSASSLLRVGADEAAAAVIFSAGDADDPGELLEPVVDRHGWVWTAVSGVLTAVNSDGLDVAVDASWLVDRAVAGFDLSAESERVVVRHSLGNGERVAVAAVLRDGHGAPTGLGPAHELAEAEGSATRDVAWYDPVTVAVLAPEPAADAGAGTFGGVRLIPVGGMTTTIAGVPGATAISGDRVSGALSVTDGVSQVWQPSHAGWHVAATDVLDVSYPLT